MGFIIVWDDIFSSSNNYNYNIIIYKKYMHSCTYNAMVTTIIVDYTEQNLMWHIYNNGCMSPVASAVHRGEC